jgi:hypothetical protein
MDLCLQPFTQHSEAFVRTGNHLHADDLAYLGGCGCASVRCGFYGGNITAEKARHITAADLLPAYEGHIGRLERGIAGFEQSAEAFAFNHSDRLLRHKIGQ